LVKQVISGSDTKSRHPCVFVLIPLYVATVLGAGFIFLQEREANDIEDQFTPVNGPAKLERAIVLENFPQSEDFSQLRLASDGTYASLIITGLNGKNILTEEAFNGILELDRQVKNIMTGNTFENLCARTKGYCMSNAILDIINYARERQQTLADLHETPRSQW
uniref:Patched 1 n=1 Tax=Sinocyclocheilus anshuiensis TaxID=1608454 RepID=A0A671SAU2_9TELE